MELYDLTMPMTPEMPVYKNREANRPSITRDRCHETDSIQESRFNINVHTGTHLDAPLHILPGGAAIETYPLERLQVACQVVDLSGAGRAINTAAFAGLDFCRDTAVLLKTANSNVDRFEQDYCYLTAAGAVYLAEKQLFLVGIDALGIERGQLGHPTHKALFASGAWILEGLRLQAVAAGNYTLHLLPLLVPGAEASPVRAVLTRP